MEPNLAAYDFLNDMLREYFNETPILRGRVTYPLSLWERVRVRAYPGSCKNELRHYNSLTTGSMDMSHAL